MKILINIDVPNLALATRFFSEAFELTLGRRFGEDVVELLGLPAPLYLLKQDAGSEPCASATRSYQRHWTPIHFDVVVDDISTALARVVKAGALLERGVHQTPFGKIATFADPFGNGFCFIQFEGRGYDELV